MSSSERFQQLTCTAHLKGDLRRSSVRATLFTGMAGVADLGLRIASTAILARLLLPEHFGIIMMVTAVTAIADQLRDLGLSTATVQKAEITHAEVSNLFWINTAAGLLITLLVCAAAPLLSLYYHDPRLTWVTCALSLNFLFGGLMVQHQALLARTLRLGSSASVRLASSVLSTALGIYLAWKGAGYWSLVWREVARSVLLALGMWLCFAWLPSGPSRTTSVRSLVGFGTHLTLANIIASLTGGMDRFLLGRLWGAVPVGIYRQAYQLIIIPTDQLLSPIYQVTQPGLSMLQGNPEKYRRFYHKVLTVVCLVTMPFSLLVAVYPQELVLVLLGRKWIECAPIFRILSFGAFIRQAIGSAAFIPVTLGRSKTYLGLTVLNNATLVSCMALGVHWGMVGIAVADVGATWVLLWPKLYFSIKDSPIRVTDFLAAVARPAAASLLMTSALFALKAVHLELSPFWTLVLACPTAVATFTVAWLLLPGGRAEFYELFSDITSAVRRKIVPVRPSAMAAQ